MSETTRTTQDILNQIYKEAKDAVGSYENFDYSYNNVAASGNTNNILTVPGFLKSVTINNPAVTCPITIYDNQFASATPVAKFKANAAERTYTYNASLVSGLSVNVGSNGDITLTYK